MFFFVFVFYYCANDLNKYVCESREQQRAYELAIEQAEYAKSEAPKLTPSNTKAKALMG